MPLSRTRSVSCRRPVRKEALGRSNSTGSRTTTEGRIMKFQSLPKPSNISNGPVYAMERNGVLKHSISSTESYDLAFKVMLVGDSGVGKTCVLIRYKDGAFLSGAFISTVGIDFRNKVVTLDDTKIKLQIWDTAGQERFRSVTHAYYRDAHALLLLYDVTNKTTFDNTRMWLGEIRDYAPDDVVIMLIANKADSVTERQVKFTDGERMSQEYGVAFMEISAKTGLNVELAFTAVARELKYRATRQPTDPKFNVSDYVRQESQKMGAGCCS